MSKTFLPTSADKRCLAQLEQILLFKLKLIMDDLASLDEIKEGKFQQDHAKNYINITKQRLQTQ